MTREDVDPTQVKEKTIPATVTAPKTSTVSKTLTKEIPKTVQRPAKQIELKKHTQISTSKSNTPKSPAPKAVPKAIPPKLAPVAPKEKPQAAPASTTLHPQQTLVRQGIPIPVKNYRLFWVKLLFWIILLSGGVFAFGYFQSRMTPVPIAYRTMDVEQGAMSLTVTVSGTVMPISSINVGSQISGIVSKVLVQPNQRVKKDQILALLDTDVLEMEKKHREIALNQLGIALRILEVELSSLDTTEKELMHTQSLREIAEQRAKYAAETSANILARLETASKESKGIAVPANELDERRLNALHARANWDEKKLELEANSFAQQRLQERRVELKERIEKARLDIEQARSLVEISNTNLRHAVIKSPIDGLVLQRHVEAGQTLAAQFTSPDLFTIISDLTTVRIVADIDEAQIGRLKPGQTATFRADAFPSDKFSATIAEIRLKHTLRNQLITYPVIFEAKNPGDAEYPNGKLLPGMTVFLDISVGELSKCLKVPVDAIRFVPDGLERASQRRIRVGGDSPPDNGIEALVYRLDEDDILEAVEIYVGANDGRHYQVLAGQLKPGERLVVGIASEAR